ncbi:MAG: hypothetical protein ACYTAO_17660 [Planctomycetota bacterium]|jgi:hypothetical protein
MTDEEAAEIRARLKVNSRRLYLNDAKRIIEALLAERERLKAEVAGLKKQPPGAW